MKDLILTNQADGSAVGRLRCEMFSNAPTTNLEILEIKDATGKRVDQLQIGGVFYHRIKYVLADILNNCTSNNVKVASTESNGAGSAALN